MAGIARGLKSRDPWHKELHGLEMELLDPEVRGDPQRLRTLLTDDFVEFGSSGRVYQKQMLIEMMAKEQHAPVLIRDFAVRRLGAGTALVTYRSVGQSGQEARRSSVWTRDDSDWKLAFHQGRGSPTVGDRSPSGL